MYSVSRALFNWITWWYIQYIPPPNYKRPLVSRAIIPWKPQSRVLTKSPSLPLRLCVFIASLLSKVNENACHCAKKRKKTERFLIKRRGDHTTTTMMMMMMMIRTTVNERVFLRAGYISVCVCVAELFICRYIKPPGRNDDDEEILSFLLFCCSLRWWPCV